MKIDSIEDLEQLADRLTSAVATRNEAIRIQDAAIVNLGEKLEAADKRVKRQAQMILDLGDLVQSLEKTTRAFAILLDAHQIALTAHGIMPVEPTKKTGQVN